MGGARAQAMTTDHSITIRNSMNQLIKSIGVWLILGLIMGGVYANPDEVSVEEQLANRLQRSLDAMYGPNQLIVRVDVALSTPRYDVQYTRQSRASVSETKSTQMNIMPGFPAIKNLSPETMRQLPFDSVTTYVRPTIQSIQVLLVVNRAFPRSQVGRAQTTIRELMGLVNGRDKLTVVYKPFVLPDQPTQKIELASQADKPNSTANIIAIAGVAVMAIFVLFYVLLTLRLTRKMARLSLGMGGATPAPSPAPSVTVSPNIDITSPAGGGGGGGSVVANPVKRYFDFVDEKSLNNLIYLLKKENVGPENIGLIINFLDKRMASSLLNQFDSKIQVAVITSLIEQKMVNRALLDKLETQIKAALECLSGGDSTVSDLFDHMKGGQKRNLLSMLEKTVPDAYRRIRSSLLLFDDLKSLTDDELRLLSGEIRVEVLATALSGVDSMTASRFIDILPRSARAAVTQFLDLREGNVPPDEIDRAQQTILGLATQLDRDGRINMPKSRR